MIRIIAALLVTTLVCRSGIAEPAIAPEVLDIPGVVSDCLGNTIPNAQVQVLACSRGDDGWPVARRGGAHANRHRRTIPVQENQAPEAAPHSGFAPLPMDSRTAGAHFRANDGVFSDSLRNRSSDEAEIILLPAQKLEGTVVDEQENPVAGGKYLRRRRVRIKPPAPTENFCSRKHRRCGPVRSRVRGRCS